MFNMHGISSANVLFNEKFLLLKVLALPFSP